MKKLLLVALLFHGLIVPVDPDHDLKVGAAYGLCFTLFTSVFPITYCNVSLDPNISISSDPGDVCKLLNFVALPLFVATGIIFGFCICKSRKQERDDALKKRIKLLIEKS